MWLLDLIDDHRAAVRYDLLRHGYRLEWLGTPRLPWGDAHTIITQQEPQQSAVARAVHPKDYDRTRETQLLEILAVMLQIANVQRGNPSGAKSAQFPRTFEDLFDNKPKAPQGTEEELLAEMKRMRELLAQE